MLAVKEWMEYLNGIHWSKLTNLIGESFPLCLCLAFGWLNINFFYIFIWLYIYIYKILLFGMRMKLIIDTSIWDMEEILNSFIYDGKSSGTSLHGYELIYTLKNLRSTLILKTKGLSLVIPWIIELCTRCLCK